jgi:hypothetical protein
LHVSRQLRTLVWSIVLLLCGGAATAIAMGLAPTRTITYGDQITLSGTVPAAERDKPISIMAHSCSFKGFAQVAQEKAASNGSYSYRTAPTLATEYSVRVGDTEILGLSVRVHPQLALVKLGPRRLRADVTTAGGTSLAGKPVVLEKAPSSRGPWKPLSSKAMRLTSSPTALNAVSSAMFVTSAPVSAFLRARLAPSSGAPCYLGAASPAFGR